MAYNINITNGVGEENILNGNYSVSTSVNGYDNSSITPDTVDIVEGTNEYNFTVAATGTLTLHVTDTGEETGTPIVGATFIRTDSAGTEYGSSVTTDDQGNAVFEYVPYAADNAPIIYYKQTSSDGEHEFSQDVVQTSMSVQTETVQVTNASPVLRTINLTDANYSGLPLNGTMDLM